MKNDDIALEIIRLKNADLAYRDELIVQGKLGINYNADMEKLHIRHANILEGIIDKIGYPSNQIVGKEACEAAWLVIQHAISLPQFMKKCFRLLQLSVTKGHANPFHLAYLSDRIAVFEGKPQLYGTAFDWDQTGILNPLEYDDLSKVNQRRSELGLNSLNEHITYMQERAVEENQKAPSDYIKRKISYDSWRKKVGWIS